MSEPFVYTGQKTTYEEWRARDKGMQPRRYYVHDTTTGRTLRDPSKERGGNPNALPIDVTGDDEEWDGSYYGDLPGLEPC